ncbi:MAG TPA: hypothetical protein P5300_07755, partial [Acidobacteriota bacterium]|nr:hypothetical protein [Acidobacteriota bacterium]
MKVRIREILRCWVMTGLDLPWKLEKLGLVAPAGNLGRPRAVSPPSVPLWCFAGILAAVPAWAFV